MQRAVIFLMAAMLPTVASAQDDDKYLCTFGELERRVEIAHEPGVEVPCSVHYYKDTEAAGEQQVLWSADSDPKYCTTKAQEFISKLEDWGWKCSTATDAAPPESEAEDPPEMVPEQDSVAIEPNDESAAE